MDLEAALSFVPTFVLAFFRLAGLFVFAPLLGSARVPKRVKLMMASVTTLGMIVGIKTPAVMPDNVWEMTVGIGGELVFGIALGMIVSFTFIAVQWAGEMIGQQMGFNMAEVFDPQFGQAGSLVGDLYFMLTLIIFLAIGGHRTMLRSVAASLETVPLLSLGMTRPLLDALLDMLTAATTLALRLAAPMFFTMLVVDLAMGCISRAIPAFNVMTAGLSIRAVIGMSVLIIGVGLTTGVIQRALNNSLHFADETWADAQSPQPAGAR